MTTTPNDSRRREEMKTKEEREGWDIRLQCTVCGFRVRRHRNDYNGMIGQAPQPTITTECSNCTCNKYYPKYPGEPVKTVHFIDYATLAEMAVSP